MENIQKGLVFKDKSKKAVDQRIVLKRIGIGGTNERLYRKGQTEIRLNGGKVHN